MEQGREVGVGEIAKPAQLQQQLRMHGQRLFTGDANGKRGAGTFLRLREVAVVGESHQGGLPSIPDALRHHVTDSTLLAFNLLAGGPGRGQRGCEAIVALDRPRDQIGELLHLRGEPPDLHLTIVRGAAPRRRVVAPLAQGAGRHPQPLNRAIVGLVIKPRLDGPPQRTTHALLCVPQLLVQPTGERLFEEAFRLRVRQHREGGIDARFHRPLAQELRAEAVDGRDVRLFEVMHGGVQSLPGFGRRRRPGPGTLQLFAQPQLEFAGRLLAERDSDDLADGGPLVLDQRDDAADQLGGFAGTCSGLDDQGLIKLAGDRLTVLAPRLRSGRHGSFLRASRSLNNLASLRRVRCSSPRPHTAR